ncbi:MAG: L-aspartate oxidase [Planctomycetales bacterium]|nr:L-aspartate oxidase [Planctomycetales bacterium]NIM09725.1 L-aspartate oxidase [Planctomycetales bacterium]NIN09200.1 L-aspartate oxidase [Planctomycetales bacterium]NIN78297.1 L-aspartate oxidase [Planctomycetales bacterium]NIO35481.1 L-aspartate oxidase [Planctomycetales bacterium]
MTAPTHTIPRYLSAFHPKQLAHHFVDVLIIGGGLAGLRAAIEIDAGLSTLVVTKDKLPQSSSAYAQGGIAGVMDPTDRFEDHVADTLRAGGGLCDEQIVKMVVHEAPQRIDELIRWGADFDKVAGELSLGREGGHSHDRIVHSVDATGREIMKAVIHWTDRLPNVRIWEDAFTVDILSADGTCLGALVAQQANVCSLVWAKQTILCTGGAGQVYRETSNPDVATGDGLALAYRAGAEIRDMEFMQFHPTMLYVAGSNRTLITEAIRGEGAHLVDCHGHRFMGDYDQRMELAPRDVVSQAIVAQMDKTRHPSVYLDLSQLAAEHVHVRFPGITATCAEFGLDVAADLIPVRPGAHYFIGGVTVDAQGRTTVPGLWAAGEVTSSGLHGANRLASNSLLEGMVFGAHAGRGASQAALDMPDRFEGAAILSPVVADGGDQLNLGDIRNTLKSLMWRFVGVRRERDSLVSALGTIEGWCQYVLSRQFREPAGWELQNMLTVAKLMIEAALARQETRGVHQRADFPNTDDPHWRRHLAFVRPADDSC